MHCTCLLLTQSGHGFLHCKCPLIESKRTSELHLRKVLRVVPYLRGRPHPDTVWKNGGLFMRCLAVAFITAISTAVLVESGLTADLPAKTPVMLPTAVPYTSTGCWPERGLFMEPPQQYTFDYQRDARIFRIAGYNCCDTRRERQWHRWSG